MAVCAEAAVLPLAPIAAVACVMSDAITEVGLLTPWIVAWVTAAGVP